MADDDEVATAAAAGPLAGASTTMDVLAAAASRRRRSASDPGALSLGLNLGLGLGLGLGGGLQMTADDPSCPDDSPPASAAGHVGAVDYPGFVERAFFVLDQTTRPRSWCLRLITWPYPLL